MILVSGATGFLGAHTVCYILQQGKPLRALKRSTAKLHEFNYIFSLYFGEKSVEAQAQIKNNLEWVDGDILDIPTLEVAFKDITEVYHCAAMVSFLQKHKVQMMEVNIEGTANMVNLALIHHVQKFCYVSSIAALGREKSGVEHTEKSKWVESNLNSNYAISKYKAEMEVWRGIEEGLNAVIVNPGVILGAGDWTKGSSKLVALPANGFPFYTAGINGYVDVRDVARAMYQLMSKSIFAERFVLVSNNLNMKDFMFNMANLFGTKQAKYRVNKWMAELAWIFFSIKGFFTGKEATITKENARASLNAYFYSSQKIKDKIGFEFTPINDTLNYLNKTYKQYHNS